MVDQKYFLQAEKEHDSGNLDEAILAKANTLVKGKEEEIKFKYIELRAEDLKKKSDQRKKEEIISKATEYGKTGGKILGGMGLIIAGVIILFILFYVLPNL